MNFKFTRNTINVKEIYDDFKNESLIIDKSYQRRKVWMKQDNIRLIETILLNLIIPEIFLWPAVINPDNGDSITHIVDGQQRINAIIDFISGEFRLQERYLLNKDTVDKFADKSFAELSPELKTNIWRYNLSIVNIDRECTIDDIKKMFYRLNLTDYSLNDQEKRNSKDSEFGEVSKTLSTDEFWEKHKIFSGTDVRRMKDVEYCGNIIILAREGIVDQTNSKKLNDIYDDLKENYPDKEKDLGSITKAMDIINEFSNSKTNNFISKKSQMYTMFSFAFFLIDNDTLPSQDMIDRFVLFVSAYSKFKNEMDLTFNDPDYMQVYEGIKKYKLASSEGVNKVGNRVIRFEVLKKFCIEDTISIRAITRVADQIVSFDVELDEELEESE